MVRFGNESSAVIWIYYAIFHGQAKIFHKQQIEILKTIILLSLTI